MKKVNIARKMEDHRARKSYHQLDLELGEDLTLPNTQNRHTIGTLKPYESKTREEINEKMGE